MRKVSKEKMKMLLKKILWVNLRYNYFITELHETNMIKPKIDCKFIPITLDNYYRVKDFREERRISEYRYKLAHNEIGFFAEYDGKMIGSQWADLNKTKAPLVSRDFDKIMPNEALLHDTVVSEEYRGMSVGPFLISNMMAFLFKEYKPSRLILGFTTKNKASLRMHEKLGFKIDCKTLFISVFGKLVLKLVVRRYA